MVYELVELEFVDLSCVESGEPVTDVVEQFAQFRPVIGADEVSRGSSLCLLGCLAVAVFNHASDGTSNERQSTDGGRLPRPAGGLGDPAGGGAMDDEYRAYPWMSAPDDRFTLALVTDVAEVLVRHGYPAPAGAVLVELTSGLFRALHAGSF